MHETSNHEDAVSLSLALSLYIKTLLFSFSLSICLSVSLGIETLVAPCFADTDGEVGKRLVGVELADERVEAVDVGVALGHCSTRHKSASHPHNVRAVLCKLSARSMQHAYLSTCHR